MSDAAPVSRGHARVVALDHLRGFLIGLVVLHHAVLAHCTFGHVDRSNYARSTAPVVDPAHWLGFDLVVRLDDGFFMPLLFLISGLFVADGLARAGAGRFLRARLARLGLPLLVAELTLVPLAYYPSYLQAGGAPGFARFWVGTVTAGPWPSGPPWFIGVLLLFDAAAALAFVLAPGLWAGAGRSSPSPGRCFAPLLAATCLLYLPLLAMVGPTRWFGLGPLAVQGSRIGLYATYFAAGAALGRGGLSAAVDFGSALARRYRLWVSVAALAGAAFLWAEIVLAPGAAHPSPRSILLAGALRATFCAAASFALPAVFLRFGARRSPGWDSLAANGFAIYLLHYPLVTWTQYGLLSLPGGALLKGVTAFCVALALSWAGARALRRLPALARIL